MLNEYESDEEPRSKEQNQHEFLSASTAALLQKLKGPQKSQHAEYIADETKIIFCSRTHSQLTQFINELRRMKPLPGIASGELQDGSNLEAEQPIKHIPLGSRKNLCINNKVSSLKTTAAINERCMELQKPGISKEMKCSFLPSKDDHTLVNTFHDHALAQIRDIEDIADLGRELHICPYYALRNAIAEAEILTLPYPLLLQKSAREALGLSVKDHVVIIDEAHNLMDAITDTYSVAITLSQIDRGLSQVTIYARRFKDRLKGKNRVYVTQIIRLLSSIGDCLRHIAAKTDQNEFSISPTDLMAGKGIDQIRPHKLIRYLHDSKLVYKVEGYLDSLKEDTPSSETGALTDIQSFLTVLMNPSEEGRLFFSRQDHDLSVRYTLLDPREHFRDIVQDARAVILAGGTMSPMSDYADRLFSYLPPERLQTFGFGHIIPPSNLLVEIVGQGPSDREFNFTYENRESENMICELGELIFQICGVVPDGVVAFFPSYDYLTKVMKVWKQVKGGGSITTSIENKKPIFEETKSGGVSTEELLREYSRAIDTGKGALMLSVVGGKLSEGINFSDKLGRAVVAIGLPFPKIHSAEWKAKIEHVEKSRLKQLAEKDPKSAADHVSIARAAGRNFYENACMRAVNQCIGRAIRHRNDYAAILLVDKRYSSPRIKQKLSAWIRGSMDAQSREKRFGQIKAEIQDFFVGKS